MGSQPALEKATLDGTAYLKEISEKLDKVISMLTIISNQLDEINTNVPVANDNDFSYT
jgi:hypothetical protein